MGEAKPLRYPAERLAGPPSTEVEKLVAAGPSGGIFEFTRQAIICWLERWFPCCVAGVGVKVSGRYPDGS